ncbi:MAG: lasso peptide biosynthesis protein [Wenzhouxiangella sp.]
MKAAEWLDLGPALIRLIIVRTALMRHDVKHCEQHFNGGLATDASRPQSIPPHSEIAIWRRRSLAFKRAARLVPGAFCLSRSLALRWWMRGHGLPAQFLVSTLNRDKSSYRP